MNKDIKPTGKDLQVQTTQDVVQSAFSSKALTKEQMNILRTQIAPDITDNDLLYCLEIADKCGLNPILKDVYFVPRMSKVNERWVTKHEPMVGRRGARIIARRKGMKIPPNTGHTIKKFPFLKNGEWIEERDLVGWAELVIEGQVVRKEASYSTYKQTKKDGEVTKFWKDMPTVMVEKVAEFQLLDAVYGLDGLMSIDAGYVTDDITDNDTFLTNEIEEVLKNLGVNLQKYNGIAIAINYNGKEKYLKEFGFKKKNGNWVISYEEIPPKIEQKSKKNTNITSEEDPAKTLADYLKDKGMTKEQIKVFVNDILGLSKEDKEGILEVLESKEILNGMIEDFLNPNENKQEVIIDTLF